MKYYKVIGEEKAFFNLNEDIIKERFHHLCREVNEKFLELINDYPEFASTIDLQTSEAEDGRRALSDKVYRIDLSASDQYIILKFSEGVPEEMKSRIESHYIRFLERLIDKKINEDPVKT